MLPYMLNRGGVLICDTKCGLCTTRNIFSLSLHRTEAIVLLSDACRLVDFLLAGVHCLRQIVLDDKERSQLELLGGSFANLADNVLVVLGVTKS